MDAYIVDPVWSAVKLKTVQPVSCLVFQVGGCCVGSTNVKKALLQKRKHVETLFKSWEGTQ